MVTLGQKINLPCCDEKGCNNPATTESSKCMFHKESEYVHEIVMKDGICYDLGIRKHDDNDTIRTKLVLQALETK